MTVKQQITKKLEDIYDPGDVSAGQVFKGYEYSGALAANGWWFKPFATQAVYLGRSKAEALDTIERIREDREEQAADFAAYFEALYAGLA